MINRTEAQIMYKWKDKNISNPLVTIYCMAYNHEQYISQALDSFLMQETCFPFEIIVHDDVSTDHTADIIKDYAAKFSAIIKPIYEVENQYSKKDGSLDRIMYENAKGKYIALCEGDDYWCDKNKIQEQADILERNPQCTISFCKVQFIEKTGRVRNDTAPNKGAFDEGIVTLKDLMYNEFRCGNWTFHTSSFFYRAELGVGYMQVMQNEFKIFPYGDMPLELYCLLMGDGYYINKIQSCYRKMSGGYSSYMEQHSDIAVLNQKKLIQGLLNFDNMTQRKYHQDILMGIRRAEFNIDVINKKVFKIISPRYNKIGVYMQLKMLVKVIFPHLYGKLVLLKHPV